MQQCILRGCRRGQLPALFSQGNAPRASCLGFLFVCSEGRPDLRRRLCGGRTAWVTEGGYHLGALRECLQATIDVLS